MAVTLKMIEDAIGSLFEDCPIEVEDEYVGFGIDAGNDCFIEVLIILRDIEEPLGETYPNQCIHVLMWFTGKEQRFDFSVCGFQSLLELCHHLQEEVVWGTLVACRAAEEEKLYVYLCRAVEVDEQDLCAMFTGYARSAFILVLNNLMREYCMLAPTMAAISSGAITSPDHIETMMLVPSIMSTH